ncbi:MAG: MerR family DNA-binding transcriptional regulator [Actinobacteria bacterium]|nr:MerR family DNA-binding transcriptional regulator [Actinomycetota bacterium]MBV9662399.1 MerR family DNA-binding transcriptional regulator [Actinomycetota bacterium]
MADRAYLSIGEVLSLLKEEFPDATISKIRFLESQGLIDPERTPSGYRKFYEADVERLRWILRQQREHFLPLKVIKGRLGDDSPDAATISPDAVAAAPIAADTLPVAAVPEPVPAVVPDPAPAVVPAANPQQEQPKPASRPAPAPPPRPTPAPRPAPAPVPKAPVPESPDVLVAADTSGADLTIEELAEAVDLPVSRLTELEKYGLLSSKPVGGTRYYDGEAKHVAQLAAGFLRFGVEARHLRMYKSAADREAGFFEQIVMPLLKQRNPQSRRQAVETLGELARLGQDLRASMLRQALHDYTSG